MQAQLGRPSHEWRTRQVLATFRGPWANGEPTARLNPSAGRWAGIRRRTEPDPQLRRKTNLIRRRRPRPLHFPLPEPSTLAGSERRPRCQGGARQYQGLGHMHQLGGTPAGARRDHPPASQLCQSSCSATPPASPGIRLRHVATRARPGCRHPCLSGPRGRHSDQMISSKYCGRAFIAWISSSLSLSKRTTTSSSSRPTVSKPSLNSRIGFSSSRSATYT